MAPSTMLLLGSSCWPFSSLGPLPDKSHGLHAAPAAAAFVRRCLAMTFPLLGYTDSFLPLLMTGSAAGEV